MSHLSFGKIGSIFAWAFNRTYSRIYALNVSFMTNRGGMADVGYAVPVFVLRFASTARGRRSSRMVPA
jgi:hypothetical protein